MKPSLGEEFRRIGEQGPEGLAERLLVLALTPLGVAYGACMNLRACGYRWGVFRTYRAPVPVISVGNLVVGGTGKTPVVDALLKAAIAMGETPGVVSRGVGGAYTGDALIVSGGQGPEVPPEMCGDEPFLLARRNPEARVAVARKRADGISRLCSLGVTLILLDDGFQHLSVHRDMDLLLLDSTHPYGNGRVLPAGILREPRYQEVRADGTILTRCSPETVDGKGVRSRHRLGKWGIDKDGRKQALQSLSEKRVVAFAGLAKPADFFSALSDCNVELVDVRPLQDHCPYDEKQVVDLCRWLKSVSADVAITTEKDFVKLVDKELGVPLVSVPLELEWNDPKFPRKVIENTMNPSNTQFEKEGMAALLACPKCKGPVQKIEADWVCQECCLRFPEKDGIPIMLVEEARPVDS